MAVYLIDTENTRNQWPDVLHFAGPGDEVYLFYTPLSVAIHMSNLDFLQSCKADVHYVSCFRTGSNVDNALDFQLVSQLGYLIANYTAMGRKECYFIVSCDGGFDSVVSYWRERNVLCQRLVSDCHDNQLLKSGPMLTLDVNPNVVPIAIKPNFARITKYASMFGHSLVNTEYYAFRHEIADIFVQLFSPNVSNDKFTLAFRNALATKYGAKNRIYTLLKSTIAEIRMNAFGSEETVIEPVKPVSKMEDKPAAKSPAKSEVASEKSESDTFGFSVRITDEAKLTRILHAPPLNNLESRIRTELPSDLKLEAGTIIQIMALTVDKSLDVWNQKYMKALSAKFDVKRLPMFVREINGTYWSNATRTELLKIIV